MAVFRLKFLNLPREVSGEGRGPRICSSPGEGAAGYLGSVDALHRLEQLVGIIREGASIFFKHTQ